MSVMTPVASDQQPVAIQIGRRDEEKRGALERAGDVPPLETGDHRNAVQEYLVFLTLEQEIVWFDLVDGEYKRLVADESGILRSRVFPGLWFHPEHLWNGNLAGLLEVLQQGLASQAHSDFIAQLEAQTP